MQKMNEIFEIHKVYTKAAEEYMKLRKLNHDHSRTPETFGKYLFTFEYVFYQYEAQKICDKVVDKFPFNLNIVWISIKPENGFLHA